MEWNTENHPAALVEVKKGAKLKGFLMFSTGHHSMRKREIEDVFDVFFRNNSNLPLTHKQKHINTRTNTLANPLATLRCTSGGVNGRAHSPWYFPPPLSSSSTAPVLPLPSFFPTPLVFSTPVETRRGGWQGRSVYTGKWVRYRKGRGGGGRGLLSQASSCVDAGGRVCFLCVCVCVCVYWGELVVPRVTPPSGTCCWSFSHKGTHRCFCCLSSLTPFWFCIHILLTVRLQRYIKKEPRQRDIKSRSSIPGALISYISLSRVNNALI